MHGTAEALLEVFAGGAHAAAHPVAFAHDLEAVVPDIQQVILIDVALFERAVNVRAGGNVAVKQHRADIDAGAAEKVAVTHLILVFAGIGFAAEFQVDTALLADDDRTPPKAPGMKYRHYAPKGDLVIVEGGRDEVISYISEI